MVNLTESIKEEFENIKKIMLENARSKFDSRIVEALDWKTFMVELNKK